MADRPIIFSAAMVRALLDGRKTQTRRVLRDQPGEPFRYAMYDGFLGWSAYVGDPVNQSRFGLDVPYASGDRLWVREAFYRCDACAYLNHAEGANSAGTGSRKCCASCDELLPKAKRSPIHMPRWASRLTLIVTQVRVQRLQDISEEDARAEGIEMVGLSGHAGAEWRNYGGGSPFVDSITTKTRESFATLWNSLHGPGAWEANQWVIARTFTVHRGNIDAMP